MTLRNWLEPPRRRVVTLALVTLVSSASLLVLGWRLVQQNAALERARVEARRNEAADLLVTRLEQALEASEQTLRDREAMRLAAVSADSVTLAIVDARLEVLPYGRLLYYPVASPGDVAPDGVFAAGEAIEHAQNDPSAAAAWFRRLAQDSPVEVRAGALVRAARNLRKAGRSQEALALYADALRLATTAIGEVPTELFARSARCSVLADLKRTFELRREALELRELLLEGRWRITRPVFEAYLESASKWAGAGEPPAHHLLALSAAVEAVWASRATVPPANAAQDWVGRRWTISAGDVPFTVLAQQLGTRTHVLVAGPAFVQDQWKSRMEPLEMRHQVRSTFQHSAQRESTEVTRRASSETGLPWTLIVRDAPPLRKQ
jgi:hypothetical protein